MRVLFWITISLFLIIPFQYIRAATSPYVIAVDGLAKQEVGISWTEWLNPISWGQSKVEKGYLAKALAASPEIRQSGAEIHAFVWSRDPGDSSRYIRKLTKEIGEVYQTQTRGQRPLVIVAHSWGTVLSYAALHALKGDVAVNGFISLGSPLNPSPVSLEKGFLTLEVLKEFLPPGLLFNNLKKPVSLKGPWFNYYAEKDLFSSQIGPAENYRIDEEPGSGALRVIRAPETERWHREYYTNPAILSRISDNLKSIAEEAEPGKASLPLWVNKLVNNTIIPGSGLAGVTWGEHENSVIAKLGKPDKFLPVNSVQGELLYYVLNYKYQGIMLVISTNKYNRTVNNIRISDTGFNRSGLIPPSTRGPTIGSLEKELFQAYGRPLKTSVHGTCPTPDYRATQFTYKGISFCICRYGDNYHIYWIDIPGEGWLIK